MFQKLYRWILSLADKPYAIWALSAVAFAESSFFPLPPDILLVPMALAEPKKAPLYAFVCTISSVLGGMLGYAIGYFLIAHLDSSLGEELKKYYHYYQIKDQVQSFYDRWGIYFILVKGLTPVPYKIITIGSGMMQFNFVLFVVASVMTRGARFYIEALAVKKWDAPIRAFLDKYFGWFLLAILIAIILGFLILYNGL